MKSLRAVCVAAVIILIAIYSIVEFRHQSSVASQVPEDIKQAVREKRPGGQWRAWYVDGPVSLAVVQEDSSYTGFIRYYFYRFERSVSGLNHEDWLFELQSRDRFQVHPTYALTYDPNPMGQRPYRQFALGLAQDNRIKRVLITTAHGEGQEAILFQGFWWLQADIDPQDYEKSKWVRAEAVDEKGNVLYSVVPQYPTIPSEPH